MEFFEGNVDRGGAINLKGLDIEHWQVVDAAEDSVTVGRKHGDNSPTTEWNNANTVYVLVYLTFKEPYSASAEPWVVAIH